MSVAVAVIGAGVIGRAHIRILGALPPGQGRLAAIVDPTAEAAALAARLGVPYFTATEAMLDAVRPDGAVIATPNALHVAGARACIARGVAALIEKPIADDLDAAVAVADEAERAGVPLLVGHFRRHNPVMQAARRLIQEGRLGRLVTISSDSMVLKPDSYFDAAWRREIGGGPVLINLVHDIDALRFLCGEIEAVQAMTGSTARRFAVEDSAAVLLRFRSGALATITLSDAVPSPWCWDQTSGENPHFISHQANAYRLCGTDASLEMPEMALWRYAGQCGWDQPLVREVLAVPPRDPLVEQMHHFLRVIRRDEAPLVSGRDGVATLAATLAVKRSAETGEAVHPGRALPSRTHPPGA
ncbi:Gfo/Idh/MocA family oxidoreductase [Roseomonas hellenica]|uniref:Gfo/Idh/MocA family oxidoreductase n=1 Tax=Plastoroseomonas hellenica TaxID=2687306 RepID=A0ABS5ES17_9PROT|nr:Gfo/Idh/MocA family oxidoreductase [Plastoroseomonas hellenica]MBR0663084.1 Gfo/Idh/MocA family oxidoreductase [Plastoroseomonas hellenica]